MKLWILGLASALLVVSGPQARASVLLNWTLVKETTGITEITGGPNGTYTTGQLPQGVDVTVQGTNFSSPPGLHDPKIDVNGPYPAPVLSTAANFKPSSSGTVTFTIDFFGFKQGVKDVSFELFNIDKDTNGNHSFADVVTFQTAGLTLIGGKDDVVSGKTVTGIGASGHPESTDVPGGDVAVHSGNMPLHEIVFNWTRPFQGGGGESHDEIALGNISFTPVPEVGQLVIGFVACLLGALWLHKNRRKRAHSIP